MEDIRFRPCRSSTSQSCRFLHTSAPLQVGDKGQALLQGFSNRKRSMPRRKGFRNRNQQESQYPVFYIFPQLSFSSVKPQSPCYPP